MSNDLIDEMSPDELETLVFSMAHEKLMPYCDLMWNGYETNWHLEILADALERVERGELKRLMVFMPPRHSKTLTASELFPSWFLGRNPRKQVIAASYGHTLASETGRKVRNTMEEEKFKRVFDGISLSDDSKAKDRFNINSGGGYLATGVGGAMTGYGADLLLIDDPVKGWKDARSETVQRNVWEWFKSTARTRLQPNGAIIIILTRWNEKDLAGMILASEPNQWEVISIPALAEEDDEYRKTGEALWPSRYDEEALEEIKRQSPDEFSCLYQQNPFAVENMEFKRDWFKYFRDDECPSNLRCFTTVDPAISKSNSADYSCVMTVGVDNIGNKYVLEYTNARLDPSELIEEIFRHHTKFRPVQVGIETVAYQQALSHFLTLEMRRRQQFLNVIEIKTSIGKEEKIRGLIAHYKNGTVFHRSGMCETLEEQLLRFPRGAHDDVIDSLSMSAGLWSSPVNSKSPFKKPTGKPIIQIMREEGLIATR